MPDFLGDVARCLKMGVVLPCSTVRHSERGIVLLEQVVALALLGVLLMSILGPLLTEVFAAQRARRSSQASHLAGQRLEAILAGAAPPESSARRPLDPDRWGPYRWPCVSGRGATPWTAWRS